MEERPEGLAGDGKGVKNILYISTSTGNPNAKKERNEGEWYSKTKQEQNKKTNQQILPCALQCYCYLHSGIVMVLSASSPSALAEDRKQL